MIENLRSHPSTEHKNVLINSEGQANNTIKYGRWGQTVNKALSDRRQTKILDEKQNAECVFLTNFF